MGILIIILKILLETCTINKKLYSTKEVDEMNDEVIAILKFHVYRALLINEEK